MQQMARLKRERVSGARHGKLRRSSSLANVGKVLLTTLIVFAVSGISVGAYAIFGVVNDVKTVELPAPASANAIGAGGKELDGALTVLLVGSDSRAGQSLDDGETGELNDVNLLLHIPADHQSATIMSFPRDLMVPIPSCPSEEGEENYYPAMSQQQINSAMMYGGLGCVAETISYLTGMEIPYAALVTFDGVINISNAIGGVTVCLAQPIDDQMTGLSLPAGDVSLQGLEALQFLRSRYGVGDGSDVSRISNQQVFMSALIRQMQSAETLSNPMKVYGLAKAGFNSLTMSSSMASIGFMQALAGTAVNIDPARINFVQYPSNSHPTLPGRLQPNTYLGDQLIEVVLSGQPFEVATRGNAAVELGPDGQPLPATPTTPAPAPDGTTPAPDGTTDPNAAPTDPNASPADPGAEAPSTQVLPEGITGQSAADVTCSAGRTVY